MRARQAAAARNACLSVGNGTNAIVNSPGARITTQPHSATTGLAHPALRRLAPKAAISTLIHVSGQSHSRLGTLIKKAELIQKEHAVWQAVSDILSPFEKEPSTTMQLMSLIRPEVWKTDHHWIDYHEEIRRIAQNATFGMARRLHIVDNNALQDRREVKLLVNLVLSEYLCRIRARVLVIDDSIVKNLRARATVFNRCERLEFTPFDCATITSQSGRYAVIFSDIRPYFIENRASPFAVVRFPDESNYVYYALRANFYRAWHESNRTSLFCLRSLYWKAKDLGESDPIDESEIREFLGDNGAHTVLPKATQLSRVLDRIKLPTLQHTIAEKERQIEAALQHLKGKSK